MLSNRYFNQMRGNENDMANGKWTYMLEREMVTLIRKKR